MIQWLLAKLVPIVMEPRKGDLNADHHGLGSVVSDARKRQAEDGGIGGLTTGEEAELSDLLNQEQPCECGETCCGSPLIDPHRPRP